MADISRADIQHAMQNALHSVRNDVSRISHVIDGMNRVGQDVKDLQHRLTNLERDINQIQNTVANTLGRPATRRYPDPYIVSMVNDINELKVRFTAIEKFAGQVSDYLRQRNEEDNEDRQYRSA
jgi:hypothetical protein